VSAAAAVRDLMGRSDLLRRRWPTLSVDQRRAIVLAVLDPVRVLPARTGLNKFDPRRFEFVWRA
jgi:hypothetical protein